MAISQKNNAKQGMVWFKSGRIYSFQYSAFQFDPEPTVLMINAIKGVHTKTGHRHSYLQGINFTYIPRAQRSIFVKHWKSVLKRYNGNIILSWLDVKRKYPFMILALRRYILDKGYITGLVEVPPEDMEVVVVKTFEADYSKRALMAAIAKNKGAARQLREPELVKKIFGGTI
jgi:hypothetical protein